jgi:hypothetical protein
MEMGTDLGLGLMAYIHTHINVLCIVVGMSCELQVPMDDRAYNLLYMHIEARGPERQRQCSAPVLKIEKGGMWHVACQGQHPVFAVFAKANTPDCVSSTSNHTDHRLDFEWLFLF